MIKLCNVTKIYKMGMIEVRALNNVNLSVERGEFIAIVGPSGSGKSTLMNILGCLDVPTTGTYELDGKPVHELNDDELAEIRNAKLGFIFQGFNLLPKLTALENVELPLIYRGVSAKERREQAIAALARVGLANRLEHRPTELSGGQQQRVAIARALVGNPSLILADEPTGNLDTKSGAEILAFLQQLHQLGNTIVMITHDPEIARKAQRILTIKDGEIVGNEVNRA
ncbi:MAG: ABC transporter ATP-binding protein [Firmicutes bacterium]|nr:ABC transporter ATP-binding protein [Bacillota bacterium]